jgi:hypothetical protein
VPDGLPVAETADCHTVFDDVRNDVYFRHTVGDALAIFLNRRMIQVAEPA